MGAQKTVLILGGGIGGHVAANILGSRLKGRHRVVLVDKQKDFVFSPSFLWLMLGKRRPQDIQRPLSALGRKWVELREAQVLKIDPSSKAVETSAGILTCDYLLIALGADLAPEKVPGFNEAAINLYTLEGAQRIRQSLEGFAGGKVVVFISSSPFKCPAAPYEAAFLIHDFLKSRNIKAQVEVYTPEPYPMPTAGQKIGEALKGMLESVGIPVRTQHKVIAIDSASKVISFENGAKTGFDLLLGVPPHQATGAARDSGLAGDSGWIPVDPHTLATKHDGIYALGDAAGVCIAAGKALPKAGVFAYHQARVVAGNILAQLDGKAPEARFDGRGWCIIETGSGRAAFGGGNFYAPEGPKLKLHSPARHWHWAKVLLEKWWLRRWF